MHPIISTAILFAIFVGIALFILNYSTYYFAQAKENLAWDKGLNVAYEIVKIANELRNLPPGTLRKYSFYLPEGTISIENRSVAFTLRNNRRIFHTEINLTEISVGKGRHTLIFRKDKEEIAVWEEQS